LVFNLSLWETSYNMVSKELELTRKKKQALDNLLAEARISPATHEYLEKELSEAISDLETYQKSLADKMSARADNLEKQIKTLELFLANLEIHRVAGEIDEETYNHQSQAITLGLEATKQELSDIRRCLTKGVPTAPEAPKLVSEKLAEPQVQEQAAKESVQEAPSEEKPPEELSKEEEMICGETEPEERSEELPGQPESLEPPTLVMPEGESSPTG